MNRATVSLMRAGIWTGLDRRVRAALVHGSVVQNSVTPLSDLDLIVVAEPGHRESIWRDRTAIARFLMGMSPAVTEVLDRRRCRWQARTVELDMLDLTIEDNYIEVWSGFRGPVEFLVDRADVASRFERDMAAIEPLARDVQTDADDTWGTLIKIASLILHRRRHAARVALERLVAENFVVLLERHPYDIGSFEDQADAELLERLDEVHPLNSTLPELSRATRRAAHWYSDLLSAWATRTDQARPRSPIESAATNALDRLLPG